MEDKLHFTYPTKGWKMRNCIVLCILITAATSCKPYRLNESRISGKFSDGFTIEKLIVESYDSSGIPKDYSVDTAISLEIRNRNTKLRKIYFDKPNENYYWLFWRPISPTKYETLPIVFVPNNWYLIWGLNIDGSPDYSIYVYVNSNGNFTDYHQYRPGPF